MKHNIFYITLFAALILGCRKDKLELPDPSFGEGNCITSEFIQNHTTPISDTIFKGVAWPQCAIFWIPIGHTQEYQYRAVVVNPSNSNEIAFLRSSDAYSMATLCIYNLCTNELNEIAFDLHETLDWSTKNWLVITRSDNQLWKIKANGDGLTQITNNGSYNARAKWSPDGTKILFAQNTTKKLIDENGSNQVTVALESNVLQWDWLNENEIVYSMYSNNPIKKFNLNTELVEVLTPNLFDAGSVAMNVVNDKVYFETRQGIYSLEGTQLNLIDSNYYNTFIASYIQPISDKYLLFNRHIRDTTGYAANCADTVYEDTYLTLYNKITKEERIILFPE